MLNWDKMGKEDVVTYFTVSQIIYL